MAKFDVESFENFFVALLKSDLGAKLTEIETEKGMTAGDLPDFTTAQYIDNFNQTVLNFDSFLYYKTSAVSTPQSGGFGFSEEITMSFFAAFTDGEDETLSKQKIFRYTRALAEVLQENANANANISELSISTFQPIELQISADSGWLKGGIVELTGVIA